MGKAPRAQRLAIQTTLRYRENGQSERHEGATVNISRRGVLTKGERLMARETRVEMNFDLPVDGVTSGVTVKVFSHKSIPKFTHLPAAQSQGQGVSLHESSYPDKNSMFDKLTAHRRRLAELWPHDCACLGRPRITQFLERKVMKNHRHFCQGQIVRTANVPEERRLASSGR